MNSDEADRLLREAMRDAVDARVVGIEEAPFREIARRGGRIRSRRRAVACGFALTLGVIGAGVLAMDEGAHREVDTLGRPATVDVSVGGEGGIEVLPPPPLDVRGDSAIAWTGSELVVWGGDVEALNMGLPGEDRSYADGAAFDPTNRTWRLLSASPLPDSFDQPTAVMTDAGVAIVRGTAAALYEPQQDTWRPLDHAPAPVTDLVSNGDRAFSYSANAVLDVDTGSWTELPEPPVRLERPTTAWTGSELIVIGGAGTPFTTATALLYSPETDSWRTAAPAPTELTAAALAADWDGERVVVVNYDMRAATYDPASDEWSDLPAVPARFSEWYPSLESVNGVTLAFMAHAVAVLTPPDTWIPLPYGTLPYGEMASTPSGATFVWGVDTEAAINVLAAVDFVAIVTNPRALQVGAAAIAVPDGYRLAEASTKGEASASEGVNLGLSNGDESCIITSSYVGIEGPTIDQPITVELRNDGRNHEWSRSEDERVWQAAATTSDLIEIACDDPRVARQLATSASFAG